MTHPPRPYRSRPLKTPTVEAIFQNLLEVETATPDQLAQRSGIPLDHIYQSLARMGVLRLVRGERPVTPADYPGRVPYNYSLTGEGKNLAAMWGLTPRPRDIPIQGHTP